MNVVPMQVFVSLLLVGASLVLFLFTVRQRDFDHADRLSLAPLEEDRPPSRDREPAEDDACAPHSSRPTR